jgi:hypothetical protein
MAQKYITLSEEALDKLLGLVRESHSVAEGIDDENIATNSTYSSAKLQELLGDAGVQAVELTKAEYDALSDEEKNSETIYFIKDTEVTNEITIVTELNETSTDTQVPSAKTIYEELNDIKEYTIESEYLTAGSVTIRKCGRLCIINMSTAVTGLPSQANTKIGTLPEEFRPISPVAEFCSVPSTTNSIALNISIDGSVLLYNYTTSTGTLNTRLNLMYFSAI